jgi:hypothetical protein
VATTVLIVGAEAHGGFMPWENWDALAGDGSEVSAEHPG